MTAPRFKRPLLKLSGEALMGGTANAIDPAALARFAGEIRDVRMLGVEPCIVIGGGNIFRGLKGVAGGMDRVTADHMGMLATVINALALGDALQAAGVPARVYSGVAMPQVCPPFQRAAAREDLAAGRVLIFAGGTGNPFFTTDTAAALRAAEMGCDAILKATSVDGVYSADPKRDPDARRFDTLTYTEMLTRKLEVMDAAAVALARDNRIPLVVFSLLIPGNIVKVFSGELPSTIVQGT
jgi:uridylate kinase